MWRRTKSVEENRVGESPDAVTDHMCGGMSEVFSGIPQSGVDSATGFGRGEESGG